MASMAPLIVYLSSYMAKQTIKPITLNSNSKFIATFHKHS